MLNTYLTSKMKTIVLCWNKV